jgi:hypothetical protein
MATPNEVSSADLYYAAYLLTAGVPLKRNERNAENGRVFFVFDTSIANIDELKTAWFNNSGKVSANTYAYNVRLLKSLVHLK